MDSDLDDFRDWPNDQDEVNPHSTFDLEFDSISAQREPLKELRSAENQMAGLEDDQNSDRSEFDFSDDEMDGSGQSQPNAVETDLDFSDQDSSNSDDHSQQWVPPEILVESSNLGSDQVVTRLDCASPDDEFDFWSDRSSQPDQQGPLDPSPTDSQQSASSTNTQASQQSIPRKRSSLGPLDLNLLERDLPSPPALDRLPNATQPAKHFRLSAPDSAQAEMDKFFGFIVPFGEVQSSVMQRDTNADFDMADFSASDEDHMEEEVAAEGSNEEVQAGPPLGRTGTSQASGTNGSCAATAKVEERKGWTLEQVERQSPQTRADGTTQEKRVAITLRLESIVMSILDQLSRNAEALSSGVDPDVDHDSSSQPSSAASDRPTKGSTPARVVILMAGRSAVGNDGHPKLRRVSWPRKVGRGKTASGGGPELAAFLRVIELVLDGLRSNTVATKRELYYRDPKLFVRQAVVDGIVDDLAAGLGVRRSELNVVAASKGMFAGALRVITTDHIILEGGEQGALTPPTQRIAEIECDDAEWVLVVEKEAVFQSLCRLDFYRDGPVGPGIILTGKGYPDVATRELLHRLAGTLDPSVPLLALVDSDPHGIQILSTYIMGSNAMAFDAANLKVPRLEWIGVKGTEWEAMGVAQEDLLPLTESDQRRARAMLKRDSLPDEWRRELEFILEVDRKAEIEVLSSTTAATDSNLLCGSQRSQPGLFIPFGSQLVSDSQEDEASAVAVPSQSMSYLFDKIGRRLNKSAIEED